MIYPFFIVEKKTWHCKHNSGCVVNAIKGFVSNFVYGYSIKTVTKILFMLIKRKGLSSIPKILLSQDSLIFGLFLSLFWGMYKSMNWFLRFIRKKEDSYNSILSGIFSSLSIAVDGAKSRQSNILLMFSRNIEVSMKLLDNKGIMKESKYWSLVMFTVWFSFFLYLLYFESGLAPAIIIKNYNMLSAIKPNDRLLKDIIFNKMRF